MSNEVIEETGPLALSIPVSLHHYGGAVTETRGALARMGQSESELETDFSDSDWCCWCSEPANATRVEYLEANAIRWRVLHTDPLGGGIGASVNRRTVRYMLIHEQGTVTPPVRNRDFDPDDFATQDFN